MARTRIAPSPNTFERRFLTCIMVAGAALAFLVGIQTAHFHPQLGWTPPIGQVSADVKFVPN